MQETVAAAAARWYNRGMLETRYGSEHGADVVVIGAGHAGCEAALACARMGLSTLLLTLNLDSVGLMPCNPAIGGTGKGHLVRELDAMGGEMGLAADDTLIQMRMLNTGKGPAVHSLRAQMDKRRYHERMKRALERQERLTLLQDEAEALLTEGGRIAGVRTAEGFTLRCRAVVAAAGVYLKSRILIGDWARESGPAGLTRAETLSAELARLGIARVYDLLTYFPRTYEDQSVLTRIADLQPGTVATVAGTIVNLQEQTGRRGLTILTAYLNDGTGILQVTWFNQKYLKKTLKAGRRVFVSGKAAYAYGGRGQFAMSQLRSFQVLEPGEQAAGLCGILPVYAATEHLNQKFFRTLVREALEAVGDLPELIPARILAAHHLMGRREALHAVHFPKDSEELKRARYRLAFSEL